MHRTVFPSRDAPYEMQRYEIAERKTWNSDMPPRPDWTEMTWQDFASGDTRRWIAVLPVAATEQHGPHLPVGVDAMIGRAYLARVRAARARRICRRRFCRCRISAFPPSIRHFPARSRVSAESDDPGLARDRRQHRARRRAQARPRHQPWRQCRDASMSSRANCGCATACWRSPPRGRISAIPTACSTSANGSTASMPAASRPR